MWVHLKLASQRWSRKSTLGSTHLMQCVARLFAAASNGTATVRREDCRCLKNGEASKRQFETA